MEDWEGMPMVQDILRLFKEFSEGVGLEEGPVQGERGQETIGGGGHSMRQLPPSSFERESASFF